MKGVKITLKLLQQCCHPVLNLYKKKNHTLFLLLANELPPLCTLVIRRDQKCEALKGKRGEKYFNSFLSSNGAISLYQLQRAVKTKFTMIEKTYFIWKVFTPFPNSLLRTPDSLCRFCWPPWKPCWGTWEAAGTLALTTSSSVAQSPWTL